MSTITSYDGFFTVDEMTQRWWRRDVFYNVTNAVGLVLLQDTYGDHLDFGIVVGETERDALAQVNMPTFDRSTGDTEIVRALRRLLVDGDLLSVIKHTTMDRGYKTVAARGAPNLGFDMAVCKVLKDVGFYEEAGVVKMDF